MYARRRQLIAQDEFDGFATESLKIRKILDALISYLCKSGEDTGSRRRTKD